jgi:hypothetical protein
MRRVLACLAIAAGACFAALPAAAAEPVTDDSTVQQQEGRLRTQPGQLVEVVTGSQDIYRRTMELYEGATSEIMAFERPPYAVPADFDEVATELPVLERGVALRVVYSAEALAAPRKYDTVRTLTEHGELARTLPALPLKLVIVDRKAARVSLTTDVYATESVAIIQSSGLLDALIALFEAYWERAHPIGCGAPPTGLSTEEARVLELLGAGFKDEAIARNLRTSMRTVGRRVERILARLDAATLSGRCPGGPQELAVTPQFCAPGDRRLQEKSATLLPVSVPAASRAVAASGHAGAGGPSPQGDSATTAVPSAQAWSGSSSTAPPPGSVPR